MALEEVKRSGQATPPENQKVAEKNMSEAIALLRQGDRKQAHRRSIEATRYAPEMAEAWLVRAETAKSFDEQLFCLNQVININPDHPLARQQTYSMLRRMLEREPSLAYVQETDHLYLVRNPNYLALAVPKGRLAPEPYPAPRPASVRQAYRWLGVALLGLLLAGVGTLLLAPLAAASAFNALRQSISEDDKRRAMLAIWLAAILWMIAFPFAFLFIIHVIY